MGTCGGPSGGACGDLVKISRLPARYVPPKFRFLKSESEHRTTRAIAARKLIQHFRPPGLNRPTSARRWPPRATSWRYTGATCLMRKPAAGSNASITGSSPSPIHSIASPQPKNEGLAGQVAHPCGIGGDLWQPRLLGAGGRQCGSQRSRAERVSRRVRRLGAAPTARQAQRANRPVWPQLKFPARTTMPCPVSSRLLLFP